MNQFTEADNLPGFQYFYSYKQIEKSGLCLLLNY